MRDLIVEYHNSITPLLNRIIELDGLIAAETMTTQRDALYRRRTGLQIMVYELQQGIRDMLDRNK